jgi:hypothetical protein
VATSWQPHGPMSHVFPLNRVADTHSDNQSPNPALDRKRISLLVSRGGVTNYLSGRPHELLCSTALTPRGALSGGSRSLWLIKSILCLKKARLNHYKTIDSSGLGEEL